MQKVKEGQVKFVFADRSKGDRPVKVLDESEAKDWLLHKANFKESEELTATVTEKLLEQIVTSSNMAKVLLNVARNKGGAGIDGISVREVVEKSEILLPQLQERLLNGKYQAGEIRRVFIPKPGRREAGAWNSECD